ncbi:GGDEF-domain containing protein, partial [bacterium]
MTETLPQINEGLMQFLYRVPIGLLQTTLAGDIVMINPMAARFLLPLAGTAELANLFTVVGSVLPDLREQARQSSEEPGTTICDDLRFTVGNGAAGETTLALGLQRLDAEHLIASVTDVTLSERAERRRLANQLHDAARID